MKKISSIVTNYDTASTGFSEGKLRDNPGDDTGSSVVAALGNDWYYALEAVIKAYNTLGAVSDNPESESNHDFLDALMEMVGQRVDGVSEWSAATTYSTADTHVMRGGMQFTNIQTTGNLNKDPLLNPLFWYACPKSDQVFHWYQNGTIVHGGSTPMHDRNHADYKQYFSMGKHRIGGYGGQIFEAYGLHIDGQGIGASSLSTIVETWFLKNTWAPGSTGSRTAVNAKGALLRAIGATGDQADLIAERLEDQMQGHYHNFREGAAAGVDNTLSYGTANTLTATLTGIVTNPITDGTNGAPRTGLKTRDQSVTVGIPYAVIMVPS